MGLGLWSRPAGGGEDVQAMEAGRERKGTLGRRTPGSDRDLGACRGCQRGGNQKRYGSHRLVPGNPWGLTARDGSADKRWRPAGGFAIQVDGRSAPRRFGGEKRVQRETEVALKGERWGRNRS